MPDNLTLDWVAKAEEDWLCIKRVSVGDIGPVSDVAGFLSQQCAEKYLKALMVEQGIDPPRVHHLALLLDSLVTVAPDLEPMRTACERLTVFAVTFRYPGESATADQAREAIALADQVRAQARRRLRLPSDLLSG